MARPITRGIVLLAVVAMGTTTPVLLSSSAMAQPRPSAKKSVSAETKLKAYKHHSRAKKHFKNKRYTKAVAEFSAAFQLTRAPGFLFNIAQCYRLYGDQRKALRFYQRLIDTAPKHELAPQAHRWILTLTAETSASTDSSASISAGVDGSSGHIGATDAASPNRPGVWRWIALGTGIAVATAGGVFHTLALRSKDDANQHSPDSPEFDAALASFRTRRGVAIAAYGVGAIALGVGIYLAVTSREATSTKRTYLSVLPSAHGVSASLNWTID